MVRYWPFILRKRTFCTASVSFSLPLINTARTVVNSADGARFGFRQGLFAAGERFIIVVPSERTGGRDNERVAVRVVPARNVVVVDHALLRPPARAAVADVLGDEIAFEYVGVDGGFGVRVTLPAGGGHLLVSVEIDFFDVEPFFRVGGQVGEVVRLVDVRVAVFIVGDKDVAQVPVAQRRCGSLS
jgi:hypothetical protein